MPRNRPAPLHDPAGPGGCRPPAPLNQAVFVTREHVFEKPPHMEESAMLYYAVVFFIIAMIAGFLGFFAIAGTAAWIAKVLFVVFLVLFVVSLLTGRRMRA